MFFSSLVPRLSPSLVAGDSLGTRLVFFPINYVGWFMCSINGELIDVVQYLENYSTLSTPSYLLWTISRVIYRLKLTTYSQHLHQASCKLSTCWQVYTYHGICCQIRVVSTGYILSKMFMSGQSEINLAQAMLIIVSNAKLAPWLTPLPHPQLTDRYL